MSTYKKEILTLLELKNEQSFYQKQKQDKKILKFLKSLPLNQLEEFNTLGSHSIGVIHNDLAHIAAYKYIDTISLLYYNNKNNCILDKTSQNLRPYLFASIVETVLSKHISNNVYNIDEIKDIMLDNIYNFDFTSFNKECKSQIKDVIKVINSLDMYDFIYIKNNFLNEHIPILSMHNDFDQSQKNLLFEYTLDIENISHKIFDSQISLGFEKYSEIKNKCENINNLNEIYLSHLKEYENFEDRALKTFKLKGFISTTPTTVNEKDWDELVKNAHTICEKNSLTNS